MQKFSNTLAGFKEVLKSSLANGIQIRSTILDANDNVSTVKPPALVGLVQSNCFAITREGQLSYVEFGKAGEWSFDLSKGKAVKQYRDGKILFEFEANIATV